MVDIVLGKADVLVTDNRDASFCDICGCEGLLRFIGGSVTSRGGEELLEDATIPGGIIAGRSARIHEIVKERSVSNFL